MLNTNRTNHIKILYLKSKFRQFGAKITISLDLLQNMPTSQIEGPERICNRHTPIFYSKTEFGQISPKTKILLGLLENLHTSNILSL